MTESGAWRVHSELTVGVCEKHGYERRVYEALDYETHEPTGQIHLQCADGCKDAAPEDTKMRFAGAPLLPGLEGL